MIGESCDITCMTSSESLAAPVPLPALPLLMMVVAPARDSGSATAAAISGSTLSASIERPASL